MTQAESARGISPRAAHRTVREPLDSYGSCHSLKAVAFRYSWAPPVARWPNTREGPAPFACPTLLRFVTTMGQSAPNLSLGTFGLTATTACAFSLTMTS